MKSIYRDIFIAIHEGKWLSIEYKNMDDEITRYWIGIKDIDLKNRKLIVEGLHLSKYTLCELGIFIDSILSTHVIEGSYCEINKRLVDDIKRNPIKYQKIFSSVANLKILNYLADCHRLDSVPYKCEYSLIKRLDRDCLINGNYMLDDEQFKEIVDNFQFKAVDDKKEKNIRTLCMNVMSINTKKGLFVLAYRQLNLDVSARMLRPDKTITICRENTIDGTRLSILQFLDADDFELLDDFEKNQELIKDRITRNNPQINGVDDMPYLIAMGRDVIIDLQNEYGAIINMYDSGKATYPIKAFFGDYIKPPERRKEYPIVLLNRKVNIDQLLAIYKAIKNPITYVQGPPGTGKTNTIINTIMTAFFNGKTVLFASYNNHPIDSVFQGFQSIKYKDRLVPFPAIRLGNNEKVAESIEFIKKLYDITKSLNIFDKTLEKNKGAKIERTRKLTALLKKHETVLDLKERKETIEKLLSSNKNFTFQVDLQVRQLQAINDKLAEIGEITDQEAMELLEDDEEEFLKYLFYASAKYIKRLDEPKNYDLMKILQMEDKDEQVTCFNQYLGKSENMKKFLRIFPIVMTTCISAHKLGKPEQYFDMVIIDEASQCNIAISLVPIIRGENLMLVGDPQQLNPVIMLDPKDNAILKQKYSVANEYDYINNSIYKTYLANDAVSDEILLSYHYRCNKKIIDFNNKKYYNGKLNIMTKSSSEKPLVYIDVEDNKTHQKNTAPMEAEKVIEYIKNNRDKKIGVITPFVNQKEYINNLLKENDLANASCGTVHAFQGDEKDVILFSLAITDQTGQRTYDWLKNNKELINVATSRAREQLIIFSSSRNLKRLHNTDTVDDVFELVEYVKTNGTSKVTGKPAQSRALGIKPYSTETEEAFMRCLSFALDNIIYNKRKCIIRKEVPISHVFNDTDTYNDLFYSGRFDFVVYEKVYGNKEYPILAIELDGKEHFEDEIVKERDKKKEEICRKRGFELIRIENSYARRYYYIKDILINFFKNN